jgi:pilus assembly protein Flp/PilA
VNYLVNLVRRVAKRRDDGASAVEYGLLVALIAVVIAGAVTALGIALNDRLTSVGDCVASASAADCDPAPAGP